MNRCDKHGWHLRIVGLVLSIAAIAIYINRLHSTPYIHTHINIENIIITAENDYGVFNAPYPWLKHGALLIEPYKLTTLQITGIDIDIDMPSDYIFSWAITGPGYRNYFLSKESITVTLKHTGMYDLKVWMVRNGVDIGSFNRDIHVK